RAARAVFDGAAAPARATAIALDRWYVVEVDPAADLPALAAAWSAHPGIEVAQPEFLSTLDSAPNDPFYAEQWGHANVGQMPAWCDSCDDHLGGVPVGTPGFDADVEGAWDFLGSYGDSNVVVAVIDNGVDLNHPDLNPIVGYDFDDGDPDPNATSGHGTRCAGIACALADNGIGSAGVAPGCRVLAIRSGSKSSERAASLVFAADNGADVVSMSWTVYGVTSDAVLEDALDYAAAADVILVTSSGNRNEDIAWLPQSHADVWSVGAASPCGDRKRSSSDPEILDSNDHEPDPNDVTCDGEYWWGSSYGIDVQDDAGAVDLLAPIILPTSDYNDDYDRYFNGTSCAAPFVAGVAALVRSAHPGWTAAQVRIAMTSTATDVVNVESDAGWDRYAGYGLVNAAGAVAYGSPPPVGAPETGTAVGGADLRIAGPNPFRAQTRLDWSIAHAGAASVSVFDAAGRRVRDLVDATASAGTYSVAWDGRDASGRVVSDGVYFVTLRAGGRLVSRRVLVLR
ncbi:S8 family serine peptidase, partial [bacterium]|nr:S8 family serine peptidase [bacterium]